MTLRDQQTDDFIVMLQQHGRLLHKVCNLYIINNAEDYKDLYQEIVLQAWLAFPRFGYAAKVSTWLYRVALNTAISYRRSSSKRIGIIPFDTEFMPVADVPDDSDDGYQQLWHLIKQLPQLEKALILLYLENNSYDEIAAIMGLTVTNVGTRLGRIREKLKKQANDINS